MDSRLHQAVTEIKSGNREKGKNILIGLIREDKNNENAWLWMSQCVDKLEDKERCFRQVLAINPSNEIAQRALKKKSSTHVERHQNLASHKTAQPISPRQQGNLKENVLPKAENVQQSSYSNIPRASGTQTPPKTKKKKSVRRKLSISVIIALVGFLGTVIAAFLGSDVLLQYLFPVDHPANDEFVISVRVTDDVGNAIPGAKALLFYSEGSLSQYSDSSGVATFFVENAGRGNLRLIVEADNYQIFEKQIAYLVEKSLEVRLEKPKDIEEKIILRTVSEDNGVPISGVGVMVAYDGNIYRQSTDSDGFALLTLPFPDDGKIDVQISVNAKGYDIENQYSTITPGKLQYVLLNPQSLAVKIPDITWSTRLSTSAASANQSENLDNVEVGSGVEINQVEGGGLSIIFLTPDSQPWVDALIKIYKQESDVNGNPYQGNRISEGRIGAEGRYSFDLDKGMYIICPSTGGGYSWTDIGCVYNVQVTDEHLTEIGFQAGQIELAVVDANGQPWNDVLCKIYTEIEDVSGNTIIKDRVWEGRTDKTGVLKAWLTPGAYTVNVNLAGYNWGDASDVNGESNFPVSKGNSSQILIEMGQIRFEFRKLDGTPNTGALIKIYTQKHDINGDTILDSRVWEGRTDDTGAAVVHLTQGLYAAVMGDNILYNIPVTWGTITQSDGASFQQLE